MILNCGLALAIAAPSIPALGNEGEGDGNQVIFDSGKQRCLTKEEIKANQTIAAAITFGIMGGFKDNDDRNAKKKKKKC
jgi:hypothetical protein